MIEWLKTQFKNIAYHITEHILRVWLRFNVVDKLNELTDWDSVFEGSSDLVSWLDNYAHIDS